MSLVTSSANTAPCGVGQRKGAGWQRRRLRENQGQGFVDREHKRSLAAGRGGRPANGQERAQHIAAAQA